MKQKSKNIFSKHIPINIQITLSCVLGLLVIGALYYPLIPRLLNYAPDSINNAFQIKVNYFYYTTQYISIYISIIVLFLIFMPISLRKLNKIYDIDKNNIKNDTTIASIMKICFNFPLIILLIVFIAPPIIVFLGLILLKQEFLFTIKVSLIILSITTLISLIMYYFSKLLLTNVLKKIDLQDRVYGIRIDIKNKLLLQYFPLVLFTIIFSFLILYSQLTEIQGNDSYDYYNQYLHHTLENASLNSIDDAKKLLNSSSLKSDMDSIFILSEDGEVYYSESELSDFFIAYLKEYKDLHPGRTYDYYGIPVQGAYINKNIKGTNWIIGIKYSVFTSNTLKAVLPLFLIVAVVNISFILFIVISHQHELKTLSNSLMSISKNSTTYSNSRLPVISNDELGDLTIAFNNIQKITQNHIEEIQNNQSTLIEQERLASLGQMIGGIAHNLKTPIMSISGAAEALHDLTIELDNSIGNPVVTNEDFHDIAKDYNSWIKKIKDYTEYMSDIITAVKGQAVNLSNDSEINFTISELLKRVDILMKHELKNAIIYLNISVQMDENTVIRGDVNSLVQIINNMISNSIQAYEGKPEQTIELIVHSDGSHCIISIQDHASGLPKKVKDKLFKEMITTKGKNGTGLGLYMSYSTIKANFNGNITFESEEGKGTTFNIILPL